MGGVRHKPEDLATPRTKIGEGCRRHTGLCGQAVKDVIDEAVHDVHRLVADAGVGVHLLQHLEDVERPGPGGLPLSLLAPLALGGLRLGGALALTLASRLAATSFRRHQRLRWRHGNGLQGQKASPP